MKKKFKHAYVYLIFVAILGLLAIYSTRSDMAQSVKKMDTSDVIKALQNKEIVSIQQVVASGDDGTFIIKDTSGNTSTIYAPQDAFTTYLYNLPQDLQVFELTGTKQSGDLLPIIQIVIVVGLFIFVMIFFVQQMQGGGGGGGRIMSFGKSKAKMTIDEKGSITFKNVAGLEEEKEEVAEIVDFLKNQNRYTQVGAKIPKGVLLVGPPGTGKTLLAKAVAGEAGVPFFSISGSDFVEMFVGVGASRVRDLFEQAKKNAPCIVFIDEIDAVGRKRGAGLGGGHDEREQTLNQLLVEMDGFGANEGVIVMAATNRSDVLDPALLRPGRFDRQIVVGRPDVKGRKDILKIHTKGKPLNEDVDIETIAKITSGFTGADLANLMNEAALLTARYNKRAITMDEVQKAFIKIGVGTEKKSYVISDEDKRITAYHEVGHAILHEVLNHIEPVHSISIIPTGFAAGYTMPVPRDDHRHITKTRMIQEIVSLLGGRAAEELVIGDITTGASNDIERATATARDMVTKYGMSPLGPIKFGDEQEEPFLGRDYNHQRNYSDAIAIEIDKQISDIVNDCYAKAKELLQEHMGVLHKASEVLIKKEKVTGREFRKLMKGEAIDEEHVEELNIFETPEDEEKEISLEKTEETGNVVDVTVTDGGTVETKTTEEKDSESEDIDK